MSPRPIPPLPAVDAFGAPDRVYTISELNAEIHLLLETTYPSIWLEGEISNFRVFDASSHWYFTLKDDRAQVAAAMFRSDNRQVKFRPADGMSVLVRARVSLFDARGTYQLIVSRLEPRGAGALHAAFEQLKARLRIEGLFDAARKRPLPLLPRRVGIVTSRDGAALRDILRVLRRRHAGLSVLLVPTRVQGEGAAAEIADAIGRAGRIPDLDVLIVGRGGGSLEDLWAFNEEIVARAIGSSPLPVISAIGHETDVTIADFVADLRAPTPSAAAEMVAASRDELLHRVEGLLQRLGGGMRLLVLRLRAGPAGTFETRAGRVLDARLRGAAQRADDLSARMGRGMERRVAAWQRRLAALSARLTPTALKSRLRGRDERLAALALRLATAGRRRLGDLRAVLSGTAGRLSALSPLAVLERGYALATLAVDGAVIRDAGQAPPGSLVDVRLNRGGLRCEVREQRRADAHDAGPPGREEDRV